MNNIILCGFMASGKSTIAKRLAYQLQITLWDTDIEIEKKYGKKIAEIFSEFGEQKFRDMEYQCILDLQNKTHSVISTGGGVLTFERNAKILKKMGKIICLERDIDRIYDRLTKDNTRPLVYQKSKEEIWHLYYTRMQQYYQWADMIIENNGSIGECVEKIVGFLYSI